VVGWEPVSSPRTGPRHPAEPGSRADDAWWLTGSVGRSRVDQLPSAARRRPRRSRPPGCPVSHRPFHPIRNCWTAYGRRPPWATSPNRRCRFARLRICSGIRSQPHFTVRSSAGTTRRPRPFARATVSRRGFRPGDSERVCRPRFHAAQVRGPALRTPARRGSPIPGHSLAESKHPRLSLSNISRGRFE